MQSAFIKSIAIWVKHFGYNRQAGRQVEGGKGEKKEIKEKFFLTIKKCASNFLISLSELLVQFTQQRSLYLSHSVCPMHFPAIFHLIYWNCSWTNVYITNITVDSHQCYVGSTSYCTTVTTLLLLSGEMSKK